MDIQKIVSSRALKITKNLEITKREQAELQKAEMTELVTEGRDRALRLLHMKFDDLERNKKELKNLKITDLAKVVGTLFDKGQIAKGEATQNIAVLSKNISKDMDPEKALQVVFEMQEQQFEQNMKK